MAMFGSKKETPAPVVKAAPAPVVEEPVAPAVPEVKRPRTLIGPGIKFTGNIEASEDIEINGRVEGNIRSDSTITVTSGGSVHGDIEADNFTLEGYCEGNAKIEKFCRITSEGSFTGDLCTAKLVTEDGSSFEGTLHLQPAKPEEIFEIFDQIEALQDEAQDEQQTEEAGI